MQAIRTYRVQAQVSQFISGLKSSGIENEWISLLKGSQVEPAKMKQIDNLIQESLTKIKKVPTHSENGRPWAIAYKDSFTNQNLLKFEIPATFRMELKAEALKKFNGQEEKAKSYYKEQLQAERERLIRDNAQIQSEGTIAPLKLPRNPSSDYYNKLRQTLSFKSKEDEKAHYDKMLADPNVQQWQRDLIKLQDKFIEKYNHPDLVYQYHSLLPKHPGKELDWSQYEALGEERLERTKSQYYVLEKAFTPVERYQLQHNDHPLLRLAEAIDYKYYLSIEKMRPELQRMEKVFSDYIKNFKARLIERHFSNQLTSTPEWDEEFLRLVEAGVTLIPEPENSFIGSSGVPPEFAQKRLAK